MKDKKEAIVATSKYARARIAPRKVLLTADLVRGKQVGEILELLPFYQNKASDIILQTVQSAIANAKTQGFQQKDLIVSDVIVGSGPTFRSGRFQAKGRYHPLRKRTTNITVCLSSMKETVNKEEDTNE